MSCHIFLCLRNKQGSQKHSLIQPAQLVLTVGGHKPNFAHGGFNRECRLHTLEAHKDIALQWIAEKDPAERKELANSTGFKDTSWLKLPYITEDGPIFSVTELSQPAYMHTVMSGIPKRQISVRLAFQARNHFPMANCESVYLVKGFSKLRNRLSDLGQVCHRNTFICN